MNKKMKFDINSKKSKNNENRNNIFLPIKIMVVIYLSISLTILILVAPYVFDKIEHVLINIDAKSAISIFSVALGVTVSMISVLSYLSLKKTSISEFDSKITTKSDEEFALYGKYSEERRYLEEKMNELHKRLIDSEVKWRNINHLLLSANEKNINNNGMISSEKFLNEFGVDINNINIEKDLAFVLTPADVEFFEDYFAVKITCQNIKMRALRGDESDLNYTHGNILSHIINHMVRARVIIANISNRNPNVCYELGIAHMMGKPTILLCRKGMEAPFDLQQKYIIFYDSEEELSDKLHDALLNIITVE